MNSKCQHRKPPYKVYLSNQEDAEMRLQRGEKQRWCPVCKLWIWEEFWAPEGQLTLPTP